MPSITRGNIGRQGSDYIIRFTKPGIDLASATLEDFVFREDRPQMRALVEGELLGAPLGTSIVYMPKTFTGAPLIFCHQYTGTDAARVNRSKFEVWFYRHTNYFYINNLDVAGASFRYIVFDNEMT
jgi:hypothetical protein